MAKESKPSSKRSSKIENSGLSAEAQIEELLHKLPNIDIDHVLEHKKLTQTFKKEDRVLHRLADLQRLSVDVDPQIMNYKPNPYNKSIYTFFLNHQTMYCIWLSTRNLGVRLPLFQPVRGGGRDNAHHVIACSPPWLEKG